MNSSRQSYLYFRQLTWPQLLQIFACGLPRIKLLSTVYPKKYAHGFVVLCFVVAMQSFIINSHEVFIHIHQGCFVGTGAIVRLPQCQWSKPDGYGKISQCITTTKHSKAKTVCIFLGIYCKSVLALDQNEAFFIQVNAFENAVWNGGHFVTDINPPTPAELIAANLTWPWCCRTAAIHSN